MKVLGIVPIKLNSKRVRLKNIKQLNNKRLFTYSLDALIRSKIADKIIVCSEDTLIEASLKYDKYIPIIEEIQFLKRPKYLSEDPSQISDVCLWILEQIGNEKYDDMIMIQPSNPFVTAEQIKEAYDLYLNNGRAFQVRSMQKIEKNVWWKNPLRNLYPDELRPSTCTSTDNITAMSYDFYSGNGSIVIERIMRFQEEKDLLTECLPYIPEFAGVDIDTEIDFKLAEILIKERRNN